MATSNSADASSQQGGGKGTSAWAALSIRERIQAMNKTLDIVEEKQRTATPNSGLLLRFSTSEETFPSSSTGGDDRHPPPSGSGNANSTPTAPLPPPSQSTTSRSSVVDIWRSREVVSPRAGSTKKAVASTVSGAAPRLPVLPAPSSKSRLSDDEDKERSNSASTAVPLPRNSLTTNPVSATVRYEKKNNFPTSIHKAQESADFTIVPASETQSPADSTNHKRSRLTELWERTGAGNSVAEAKQRLGFAESSNSASPVGMQRMTTSQSSPAPPSTAHAKDGETRPGSRTGTVSPADTTFSTGTVDTKRSTVTDIWELRCRKHASDSTKDRDADRPSSVPPPSSTSRDDKKKDRPSFPHVANKPRGDVAVSKTVGRVVPFAGPLFPPRPSGETALVLRKQRATALDGAKSQGEASPLSGVKQDSQAHGSISRSTPPESDNQSSVRRGETTEKQVLTTGQVDLPQTNNALPLRPIPRALPTRPNEGRIAADAGSESQEPLPKRGSVADRWKGTSGDTRHHGNISQRESDDATASSTAHGQRNVSDRWKQHLDNKSSPSRAAPDRLLRTKSAAATIDVSRNSGNSAVPEKPSTKQVVSRWSEMAKSKASQSSPTSSSPEAKRTGSQSLAEILTHQRKPAQSLVKVNPRSSCPITPSVDAKTDESGSKQCQASPTFRSNYRKVADHWLKVTSDTTAKPSSNVQIGKQGSSAASSIQKVNSVAGMPIPSPRAQRSLPCLAKTSVEVKQRNAASSTANMANSVQRISGSRPVGRSHVALRAPNNVKTVTVSSPDSVEVIQRGDFGGELSRCVLADALSNDSQAPETDIPKSKASLDGQAREAASEDADEHSDESKQKPAKIIKSWNVKVYQTEQMPSSPRFSRQHTTLDLRITEVERGHELLNRPMPQVAMMPASSSSAFNTWNATPRHDVGDGVSKSSVKATPRLSEKLKRDFVSLGRKHVVQGLATKNGTSSRSASIMGERANVEATVDVVQSTSSDDSLSVVLGSPSRNGLAAEENEAPTQQSVNPLQDDSKPTADVSCQESTEICASSTKRKVVAARKHLPSPMMRRKKMAREAVTAPAVAQNLSDIVEGRSEDSNASGPLSPRTKELNLKKRGLLAQRRKLKLSMKDAVITDSSQLSTTEEDSDSLPPGRHQPPITNNLKQQRDLNANGSTRLAGYPSLQMPSKGKRVQPSMPRSPVSDVDFSFLTDANSVNSGMTSILSAGSLSNRAEKVLTGRKRQQRKATGPVCTITENRQPSPSIPVTKRTEDLPQGSSYLNPHVVQAFPHGASDSANTERPRLETRYNTSSRFLDATKNAAHRDGGSQEVFRTSHRSSTELIRPIESTGSSYQSAESASDESDLQQPAKRHTRSSRSRNSRKSIAQQPSVASEQFLAENAANFSAFSTAYKRFSLRDIANDLAGEIKLLGIDPTSFASTVNSKIAHCVSETKKAKGCHEYLGFGDEDVAIEVEFMEEELEEDGSNSIEDDDYDDSTLEEPANIQRGTRSICAPLGYQGAEVS